MHIWFFICGAGAVAIMPPYILSIVHLHLQDMYGKEKGIKIGEISGIISGWGARC